MNVILAWSITLVSRMLFQNPFEGVPKQIYLLDNCWSQLLVICYLTGDICSLGKEIVLVSRLGKAASKEFMRYLKDKTKKLDNH